jgi:hypothetical protein
MHHAGHMAGSRGRDWRYPVSRRRWAIKCHAHNRRGEPCGRYAITGGFVCRSHGGALKRTIEAAQRRLAEAAAIERLYQVGGDELVLRYRLITAPDPVWRNYVNRIARAARDQLEIETGAARRGRPGGRHDLDRRP